MFSLCIPTMNRFDTYLRGYLEKYLNNPLISEIVITDENGNDVQKIKQTFPDNNKLKLHVNEKRLGPFLNKIKACKLATNTWIALIDSDNFADIDYFNKATEFIEKHNPPKNSIISPCYASETFNFNHFSTINGEYTKLNKENFNKLKNIELQNKNSGRMNHILNIGNYILNKFVINTIDLTQESELIKNSHSFDVILMNYMFFTQLDVQFYIVNGLKYNHVISNDSVYLSHISKQQQYARVAYAKMYQYFKQ